LREATDLGISAGIRRELSGRRVDISKLKFPVADGVVTLQGEFSFVGIPKNDDEIAIELKFIESSLNNIGGVKEVKFELTNWAKNSSGIWSPSGKDSAQSSSSVKIHGEGIVCSNCDYVIRFCPCCGKPLNGKDKKLKKKRTLPPIKSSGKKNRLLSPIKPVKPVVKKEIKDNTNDDVKAELVSPAALVAPVAPAAPEPTQELDLGGFPSTDDTPMTPVQDSAAPAAPVLLQTIYLVQFRSYEIGDIMKRENHLVRVL